jgi:hypothetical protein
MILGCHLLLKLEVSYCLIILDIEIFLGDNNDLEQDDDDIEENNNMDEPDEDDHIVDQKEVAGRGGDS